MRMPMRIRIHLGGAPGILNVKESLIEPRVPAGGRPSCTKVPGIAETLEWTAAGGPRPGRAGGDDHRGDPRRGPQVLGRRGKVRGPAVTNMLNRVRAGVRGRLGDFTLCAEGRGRRGRRRWWGAEARKRGATRRRRSGSWLDLAGRQKWRRIFGEYRIHGYE